MSSVYKDNFLFYFFTFFLIIIALLLLNSYGFRKSDVNKYAELYEWESYRVEGYCWFGCSKGDLFATKFVAVKNGKEINGCVCSGIFKNSTLRLQ